MHDHQSPLSKGMYIILKLFPNFLSTHNHPMPYYITNIRIESERTQQTSPNSPQKNPPTRPPTKTPPQQPRSSSRNGPISYSKALHRITTPPKHPTHPNAQLSLATEPEETPLPSNGIIPAPLVAVPSPAVASDLELAGRNV